MGLWYSKALFLGTETSQNLTNKSGAWHCSHGLYPCLAPGSTFSRIRVPVGLPLLSPTGGGDCWQWGLLISPCDHYMAFSRWC